MVFPNNIVKGRRRKLPGYIIRLSRDRRAHTAMEEVPGVAVERGEDRLRPGQKHLRNFRQKWKPPGIMLNQLRKIVPDGESPSSNVPKRTGGT